MSDTVIKRGASLRDQIVTAVLQELQDGVISPGERITEEGLARRHSVSRTPIREALAQLALHSVIRARPGGGYVVPLPTPAEARETIAVRKLLEPPAVRMAAEEFGDEQIEALTKAISREGAAATVKSPTRFARANKDFRNALFQNISNKVLRGAIAQFDTHLHLIRSSTLSNLELRKEIVDRQLGIRDAIVSHDAALGERLWIEYLDLAEATLIEAIVNWSQPH
jgi:DNA-binding GntR family transcriptional regulator